MATLNNPSVNSTAINTLLEQETEAQIKAAAVIAEIRKQNKINQQNLALKAKAVNKTVSNIQKMAAENAKLQKEADAKALREMHQRKLVEVGLTAEAFPLETAVLKVDEKVAAPVLGFFGKIGKVASIAGQYVGHKVKNGYQS